MVLLGKYKYYFPDFMDESVNVEEGTMMGPWSFDQSKQETNSPRYTIDT